MTKLLIINGPNMNLLSVREPSVYGNKSYDELVSYVESRVAESCGEAYKLEWVQSNHEGVIVDEIQRAYFEGYDGIVINPAGYSHTSVAIMDAIKAIPLPVVLVHLTDPRDREYFRKTDYVALAADCAIRGHGFDGYVEAINWLIK